jgi:amino acid adenylation domain-containing protein
MEPVNEPRRPGLVDRFRVAAARHPGRTAVRSGSVELTYPELDVASDGLALRLLALGEEPESPVGLLLDRRAELIVAIIACWKAGLAYCPLPPDEPPARLAAMIRKAGVHTVLTGEVGSVGRVPGVRTVEVDLTVDATGAAPPAPDPTRGRLAYVIHTSGSTGERLPVEVTEQNLLYLVDGLGAFLDRAFGPDISIVGVNAPAHFDASVKQIVQLLAGRTLRLLSAEERRDPRALAAAVARDEIRLLDITPSHLRLLLRTDRLLRDFARTWLLIGGEPLTEDLCRALRASHVPDFANVYGPTECTVDATAATSAEAPSIGRPLPGVRAHVVDPDGVPVGPGGTGELYLSGAGVARGYRGAPDEAAGRFRLVPTLPGSPRCFATGDLCRWSVDGTLHYVGRRDDQVKLGGRRASLAEVESALRALPPVADAAAALVGEHEEQVLVAVVVPTRDPRPEQLAATTLRAALVDGLPRWLIPTRIHVVDAIPLTDNGKLDRAAVGRLAHEPSLTVDAAPPSAAIDRDAVARLFAEALDGLSTATTDLRATDFFEAGGDSLGALRLVRRVERHTGRSVDLAAFFGQPTVDGLAAATYGPDGNQAHE